jgi:hypothetical protein
MAYGGTLTVDFYIPLADDQADYLVRDLSIEKRTKFLDSCGTFRRAILGSLLMDNLRYSGITQKERFLAADTMLQSRWNGKAKNMVLSS